MEIVISFILIILVTISIVFQIILFFKKDTHSPEPLEPSLFEKIKEPLSKQLSGQQIETIDRLNDFQKEMTKNLHGGQEKNQKELTNFQGNLIESVGKSFHEVRRLLDEKLKDINEKVTENIDNNFKKTNDVFQGILQRIAKLDEAQKKMEDLSKNVISLQDVLTDKKTRGGFGEIQLKQILQSVFGEKNDKLYQMEYSFIHDEEDEKKTVRADAVIFFPEPTGMMCIDSKFPLENYQRMIKSQTEQEKKEYSRLFKANVKKHVSDISSKYITKDTAHMAILFFPSEAIFSEVHAYHPKIIEYAQQKNIVFTSPTTLFAICGTVQVTIKDIEIQKQAGVIQEHLLILSREFTRYQDRWNKLANSIETVGNHTKELKKTSDKISTKFSLINQGKVSESQTIGPSPN